MTELRPLSAPEHAVLAAILSFQAAEHQPALSAQIGSLWVADTGSPHMLDLVVGHLAPAALDDGPLPGRTMVVAPGGELTGEIVVWIRDGLLSGLEHAWFTDDPPTRWPEPRELSSG